MILSDLTSQIIQVLVFIGLLALQTACAGPMTPFGAIDSIFPEKGLESVSNRDDVDDNRPIQINDEGVSIAITPDRQVWHQRSDLTLRIDDVKGISPQHELTVVFNGIDVTNRFMLAAHWNYDESKKSILYDFRDLRLRAADRNQIVFYYRRAPGMEAIVHHYQEPLCYLRESRGLASVNPFETSDHVLGTVRSWSKKKGMNPRFMAGLIAQESGFDGQAVSWAKAIGLTQITSLAAEHVRERHPRWPQYEAISKMSAPLVKAKILTGDIHPGNEWRLDDEKSVLGAIDYIEYIQSYWQSQENVDLLRQHLLDNPLAASDIVLASYNSGPARVKKNLKELGRRWLEAEDLYEARRYVARVRSFCYHFSAEQHRVALLRVGE